MFKQHHDIYSLLTMFSRCAVFALTESGFAPRVLQEANLAAEVGLIVLDVMGTYCTHFKVGQTSTLFNNSCPRVYTQVGRTNTLQ